MSRIQSPGLAATFTPAEIEAARRQGKLLSLDISLTTRCNFHCVYCYVGNTSGGDGELTYDEVISIIDEACGLGLKALNLTGGEPLLHPRYFDIARYAKRHDIAVLLFTNGEAVSQEVAGRISELGIAVCVKLDALSGYIETYLTGYRSDNSPGQMAIANLFRAGYSRNLPLALNAVACRRNLSELPLLWRWARERGITPFLTRLQPIGRAAGRHDLALTATELHRLFQQLSAIDDSFGERWEPETPWVHNKPCRRHFVGAFIDSHGNVQPCSGVPIKAGNIRKQTLGEIIAGSDIFHVARRIDKHVEGACAKCVYKERCYGCRSMAHSVTGSFTAADPLCWHNPHKTNRRRQTKKIDRSAGPRT